MSVEPRRYYLGRRVSPELIAAYRGHRAARRPAECDGSIPCWVEDPFGAIGTTTKIERCLGCGGQIGLRVNHKPRRRS